MATCKSSSHDFQVWRRGSITLTSTHNFRAFGSVGVSFSLALDPRPLARTLPQLYAVFILAACSRVVLLPRQRFADYQLDVLLGELKSLA